MIGGSSIYDVARTILKSKLDVGLVITYYREMPEREVNPDQWDRQLKFWSDVIKRWGMEACVMQFSVSDLTKALMYDNLYPPIQPSLDLLVKTKVLKTKEDCLSAPSMFTKVVGYMLNSAPKRSEFYVFSENLKEQAIQVCERISSQASLITDLCITNSNLRDLCGTALDNNVDLIVAEFSRLKNFVECFDQGCYVKCSGFRKPSKSVITSTLSMKVHRERLDLDIEKREEQITAAGQAALMYHRQGRKQQAVRYLQHKKELEKRVSQLYNMRHGCQSRLDQIDNGDLNETTFQNLKGLNALVNLPSVEDVEKEMDNFDEMRRVMDDVGNAWTPVDINDEEIEAELNALLAEPQQSSAERQTLEAEVSALIGGAEEGAVRQRLAL